MIPIKMSGTGSRFVQDTLVDQPALMKYSLTKPYQITTITMISFGNLLRLLSPAENTLRNLNYTLLPSISGRITFHCLIFATGIIYPSEKRIEWDQQSVCNCISMSPTNRGGFVLSDQYKIELIL
ncbi:hypothetical protein TNIN_318961 [Trichonephila inaurata madagascariensis]|uniref:Uncharacterized protein n=1 Tax=Trichonephila inaurata madagascariensis TaxID=2747483 RepID=A0A8X6XU75_9ARAC|nr:hypothetical protein TNIN_318961 [Trichonephila inaurata madagascariensis]